MLVCLRRSGQDAPSKHCYIHLVQKSRANREIVRPLLEDSWWFETTDAMISSDWISTMSFHLCCQVLSLSGGSAAEAHTHTHRHWDQCTCLGCQGGSPANNIKWCNYYDRRMGKGRERTLSRMASARSHVVARWPQFSPSSDAQNRNRAPLI